MSINATFINRFLSLFDFKRELPATRQREMGIDNARRGRWPCPGGPSPRYQEGLGGGSGAVGCGAGAEGVTGSPTFPHQLMGPWRHQSGQEEWGAQAIKSNTFVVVSGAPDIWEDNS